MKQANKGKDFENIIETACSQYELKKIALIQKVPTPVKVIRQGAKIVNAFFEKKSTVDFIGNFQGVPVAFDAKQTSNKKSFPLSKLEDHQKNFLEAWQRGQGQAFLLIECLSIQKTFLLKIDLLQAFSEAHERKSIPFEWLEENCPIVTSKNGVVLDFLHHLKRSYPT